jgi:hypothetical protein
VRASAATIDQRRLRSQQRFGDERIGRPIGQLASRAN